RFAGSDKKTFVTLDETPVWLHSARLFASHADVRQTIVVISPSDLALFSERFSAEIARLGVEVIPGGDQRSDSVQNGLAAVSSTAELVAIHDGARPCFTIEIFQAVVDAARKTGAAIPAVPLNSTVKRVKQLRLIETTVDRSDLFLAQTPQVFRRDIIQEAYQNRGAFQPTDEASLLEDQGVPVEVVAGSKFNIKITQPEDLRFAAACLAAIKPAQFDSQIDNKLR
ncbi:UNVERIFIED_CONTAM: hypothetical protein GTU68_038056, partial [Idotea baltica]|nr:hypothetical protein [Idotea baltica]